MSQNIFTLAESDSEVSDVDEPQSQILPDAQDLEQQIQQEELDELNSASIHQNDPSYEKRIPLTAKETELLEKLKFVFSEYHAGNETMMKGKKKQEMVKLMTKKQLEVSRRESESNADYFHRIALEVVITTREEKKPKKRSAPITVDAVEGKRKKGKTTAATPTVNLTSTQSTSSSAPSTSSNSNQIPTTQHSVASRSIEKLLPMPTPTPVANSSSLDLSEVEKEEYATGMKIIAPEEYLNGQVTSDGIKIRGAEDFPKKDTRKLTTTSVGEGYAIDSDFYAIVQTKKWGSYNGEPFACIKFAKKYIKNGESKEYSLNVPMSLAPKFREVCLKLEQEYASLSDTQN